MDAETLKRLVAGDKALFADLVRDHHRALLALVIPMVGRSDADEVVQSAWVKAYQAIGSFEGRAQIRTWLSRIAINEANMRLRQRRREPLFADLHQPEDGAANALADRFLEDGHWGQPPATWDLDSPENLLMRSDLANCLERLLNAMPARQRAVLELRDSAELDFDAICNELDISPSNARVLLHRARSQLFKLVDHYEETGEC